MGELDFVTTRYEIAFNYYYSPFLEKDDRDLPQKNFYLLKLEKVKVTKRSSRKARVRNSKRHKVSPNRQTVSSGRDQAKSNVEVSGAELLAVEDEIDIRVYPVSTFGAGLDPFFCIFKNKFSRTKSYLNQENFGGKRGKRAKKESGPSIGQSKRRDLVVKFWKDQENKFFTKRIQGYFDKRRKQNGGRDVKISQMFYAGDRRIIIDENQGDEKFGYTFVDFQENCVVDLKIDVNDFVPSRFLKWNILSKNGPNPATLDEGHCEVVAWKAESKRLDSKTSQKTKLVKKNDAAPWTLAAFDVFSNLILIDFGRLQ